LDPTLREDSAQDAYEALLTGNLTLDNLDAGLKRIVRANYATYASKFGPVSLDRTRFDDGRETYLDRLEDPEALAAFDLVAFANEEQDVW
jgi:hypothetical protein